jgi:hypothetical protein
MTPYYEEPGITIYHGDCLEVLEESSLLADLVLTDPPYGIGRAKGKMGVGKRTMFGHLTTPSAMAQVRAYPDTWDKARPRQGLFALILARSLRAVIFGGNYFADLLPPSTHWLVWDKLQTMPTFSDCELAWTNVQRQSVRKKVVEWNGLIGKERERCIRHRSHWN